MLRSKSFAAATLFLCFSIFTNLVNASQSVFVISNKYDSVVKPYLIDANHVHLQATADLLQEGYGAFGLAVWPQRSILFTTFDEAFDNSTIITWSSTQTLVNLGQYAETNLRSSNANGFGGIVVDAQKEKIYVTELRSSYLHVYKWNDANQTIEPNAVYDLSAHISLNGMYGIALDSVHGLLYVTDDSTTVKCFNTSTWQYDHSVTLPYPATSAAVDPNRHYLYTGQCDEQSYGNQYLVRTDLSNPPTYTYDVNDLGYGNWVIALAVDTNSGLVYSTVTDPDYFYYSYGNGDFRVYNSNLKLQDSNSDIGYYSSGPAGIAVGGYFQKTLFVKNVTKDINYVTIQSAIDAADINNVIMVYPGTYREDQGYLDVNSSKKLTIEGTNPKDRSVVAQTIIQANGFYTSLIYGYSDSPATINLNNNGGSTFNGLRMDNDYSTYCISSYDSTVKVLNCMLNPYASDVTTNGGEGCGIEVIGGNITVTACEIYPGINGYTSGIYAVAGDVNVSDCTIDGRNGMDGCGIYTAGESNAVTLTVQNCLIKGFGYNGIMALYPTWVKINNNRICDNAPQQLSFNGGVYFACPYQASELLDNMVYRNGCGIYIETNNQSAAITSRNNTVADNNNGLVFYSDASGGTIAVSNSIIWGNTNSQISASYGTVQASYSCVQGSPVYTGTGNINSDPCFYYPDPNGYHLSSTSPCRKKGYHIGIPAAENDIDGDPRVIDANVDIGADEYRRVDDFYFASFAYEWKTYPSEWLTHPTYPTWNGAWDFNGDSVIDSKDLLVFADSWLKPPLWPQIHGVGTSVIAVGLGTTSQPQPVYSPPPPPTQQPTVMWLVADNNTPDPNTDVTVYVHSQVPLTGMYVGNSVAGDANITTAMSTADCNQYGWDTQWSSDPYIDDVNGLVYINAGKWGTDSNTVVGYFKFHYNSGSVNVSITADSAAWDANCQDVGLSTASLNVGCDPNDPNCPNQQQSMMRRGSISQLTNSSNQQPVVNVNALANWAQNLWNNNPDIHAAYTQDQWQAFINAIKSGQ